MRSWVFRHRARLRRLFCPHEPEPRACPPGAPEGSSPGAEGTRPAPGTLRRTARYLVLVPMGTARARRRRAG